MKFLTEITIPNGEETQQIKINSYLKITKN